MRGRKRQRKKDARKGLSIGSYRAMCVATNVLAYRLKHELAWAIRQFVAATEDGKPRPLAQFGIEI